MSQTLIESSPVLGIPYSRVNLEQAIHLVMLWSSTRSSRFVCFSNVHSCITAHYDENFHNVLNNADLVCPDGAPIAWMMRQLGVKQQRRVSGPDFFWEYCKQVATTEESIFLYGSDQNTIDLLEKRLQESFPQLTIAGTYSPPYRYINQIEDQDIIERINQSGAGVVWVSLGCPKQEVWMANHTDKINAVLLGVGAAFNFFAGTQQRAPMWMRKNGLEWLHRLCTDPLRLGKRYLFTNSIFMLKAIKYLLFRRGKGK